MASINIKEDDFNSVFEAANNALEKGDFGLANKLDILARKINASLSNNSIKHAPMPSLRPTLKWQDVPSTLCK